VARKNEDDARNFSMGDAIRNEDAIRAANVKYREIARAGYGSDKDEASRVAAAMRAHATEEGKGQIVEVENTGSRREPNWTVIVSEPKGKKK